METDRQIIKYRFEQFITALETNNLSIFDSLFDDNTMFNSNTLGKFLGVNEAKARFDWKGSPISVSRYRIYNHTLFVQNDTASQVAYIVALVGRTSMGYLHHFQFGGHYQISWKLISGVWKIVDLRYCHDMEFGNTAFVDGWWRMIDYSIFNGYEDHPIDSKISAPWRKFKDMSDWSDEEQIIDTYNRYAWGIDENDFEIMGSALSDSVIADINGKIITPKKELITFLRSKRLKENTMSHVGKVDHIEIEEDTAKLFLYRYEPHRIGNSILNIYNMNNSVYSVSYQFNLIKEQNIWIISRINYDVRFFAVVDDGNHYQ